jgi:hypothetical protein
MQGSGAQLGHHTHLYCRRESYGQSQIGCSLTLDALDCNTSYHHNYSVQNDVRTYYAGVPGLLQIADHHFVDQALATQWQGSLVLGW